MSELVLNAQIRPLNVSFLHHFSGVVFGVGNIFSLQRKAKIARKIVRAIFNNYKQKSEDASNLPNYTSLIAFLRRAAKPTKPRPASIIA